MRLPYNSAVLNDTEKSGDPEKFKLEELLPRIEKLIFSLCVLEIDEAFELVEITLYGRALDRYIYVQV